MMGKSYLAVPPSGSRLAYDRFADVYNRFFAPEAAADTFAALNRILLRDLPAGAKILDLCCGTGQLTRALVAAGYHVTGVDNSLPMLQHARINVPEAEFIEADIEEFMAPDSFDIIICAYNSLAHLANPEGLLQAFRNVRRSLAAGNAEATFIFDLHSEAAFQERWQGEFSKVDQDFVCIFRPAYDVVSREAANQVTTFHRAAEWVRTDFVLNQHCFTHEELAGALKVAGFGTIETYDAEYDLGIAGAGGRIFWKCRVV